MPRLVVYNCKFTRDFLNLLSDYRAIGRLAGNSNKRRKNLESKHSYTLYFNRLGFSVFLNSGNASENMGYDNNEFMPEACQISLDYAGTSVLKKGQYKAKC